MSAPRSCVRCAAEHADPCRYCPACRPRVIEEWRRHAAVRQSMQARRAAGDDQLRPALIGGRLPS